MAVSESAHSSLLQHMLRVSAEIPKVVVIRKTAYTIQAQLETLVQSGECSLYQSGTCRDNGTTKQRTAEVTGKIAGAGAGCYIDGGHIFWCRLLRKLRPE